MRLQNFSSGFRNILGENSFPLIRNNAKVIGVHIGASASKAYANDPLHGCFGQEKWPFKLLDASKHFMKVDLLWPWCHSSHHIRPLYYKRENDDVLTPFPPRNDTLCM